MSILGGGVDNSHDIITYEISLKRIVNHGDRINMKQDKKKLLKKAIRLYELYQSGKISRLAQHEVFPELPKNSRENYLYFTLPVSINFQRSSPAMWQSAFKTWNDQETRYLFFPEKLKTKQRNIIRRDLLKYRLAAQTNKHPQIWIKISDMLNKHFKNNPRKVLEAGDMDVSKIIRMIQHEKKIEFPYLGGPKLSNYWLYIMSQFTDVKLKNLGEISIIPDTHVIQSSIRLGLVREDIDAQKVAVAWKELLGGSKINPVDMHAVLWNWSRGGFVPEVK